MLEFPFISQRVFIILWRKKIKKMHSISSKQRAILQKNKEISNRQRRQEKEKRYTSICWKGLSTECWFGYKMGITCYLSRINTFISWITRSNSWRGRKEFQILINISIAKNSRTKWEKIMRNKNKLMEIWRKLDSK